MFVTVFLVNAREYTVIPEKFVYDLNKMNLFNFGLNSNQNRLIYFSKNLFEALESGGSMQENEIEPNFSLPPSVDYPLKNGVMETCFIARLKKFWGMK